MDSTAIIGKTREEMLSIYAEAFERKDTLALRWLCLNDLFFLLLKGCNRTDINSDFVFDRCREVQFDPDGNIDLWSRGHYKSTIITFGLTIQDILKDPEITFGLFSFTRPIAKAFLSQIKRELEINSFIKELFPEVLYKDPEKEAPKWSLDDGIVVKRQSNPKEQTIEAWGLVDNQPTSKHYKVLLYDDVVVGKSVTTPDQILKTTIGWESSLNLCSDDPKKPSKFRYAGTRWHSQDTYATIIKRKSAKPRIHAATDDGTFTGKPVYLTQQQFDKKVESMGTWTAAAQLLLNPLEDKAQSFNKDWLRFYNLMNGFDGWNKYILVDAANAKKKTSDYTVIAVIGLAPDNNYYLLQALRDRMNLTERTTALFSLVRQWEPIAVGYEQYGMMADAQHIQYVQEQENFRFRVIELGGSMPKTDRIKRLVPILERNRFWFPHRMPFIGVDGKVRDFMQEFLKDEYEVFPIGLHDDMLDAISRILDKDLLATFPKIKQNMPLAIPQTTQDYDPLTRKQPVNNVHIGNAPAGLTWQQLMTQKVG